MSRERAFRAMRHGARRLDHERWQQLVAKAELAVDDEHRFRTSSFSATEVLPSLMRTRPVTLRPTQFVIEAQDVLDLELALTEASMLAAELEEHASEDLDGARRARLLRTIETARRKIADRLKRESS